MNPQRRPLGPDATIGILGGGQLGRMLVLAAARLGFRCHVLCPDAHSPAFDVVRSVTEADYLDMAALDRFAADVDVITYEFENVPAETATFLSARKLVLPDPKVLAITQDRLSTSSATEPTLIPAERFGGSTTFSVVSRGVTSTPRSSGFSVSTGFFFAFMMLGSEA